MWMLALKTCSRQVQDCQVIYYQAPSLHGSEWRLKFEVSPAAFQDIACALELLALVLV